MISFEKDFISRNSKREKINPRFFSLIKISFFLLFFSTHYPFQTFPSAFSISVLIKIFIYRSIRQNIHNEFRFKNSI